MALPTGAISWGDIRTEFVQSGAFSLTQCYRSNGSSVMPFTNGTSGIPASGTISASNFQGKSGYGTFQTFVAGSMIALDKGGSSYDQPGFDLNVANSSSGSSSGTIKIGGNNKRTMVNRLAWIPSGSYSPVTTLDIYFVQSGNASTVFGPSYDAGDLNLANANGGTSGSFLEGKTLTIYNGTGTGGSVVLTSVISGNKGQQNITVVGAGGGQYHAPSDQTARFGVGCTYESATLTTGNTYSFTIA